MASIRFLALKNMDNAMNTQTKSAETKKTPTRDKVGVFSIQVGQDS
jgi:hypothetical protein